MKPKVRSQQPAIPTEINTSMNLDQIEKLLQNKNLSPNRQGQKIQCKCPVHGDKRPSLSVSEGNDGKILIKCHKECETPQVVEALGLTMADLFQDKPKRNQRSRGRIVKAYDYTDQDGTLMFQKVRFEPKDFVLRRPDPDKAGDWIWNMQGVFPVLYKLPSVIAAVDSKNTIFIAEGEKDCDNLSKSGVIATCNPHGGSKGNSKWLPLHTNSLRGANRVVVIADKDETGRTHSIAIAEALYGVVGEVRILEMPDHSGREVKDYSDWLEAGGTPGEFKTLVEQAQLFKPAAPNDEVEPNILGDDDSDEDDEEAASIAEKLVRIAESFHLFQDEQGATYVDVPRGTGSEVLKVRAGRFAEWLGNEYRKKYRGVAKRGAIDDARTVICGVGSQRGLIEPVFIRVGKSAESIVVDLNDQQHRVVEITALGWSIKDKSPVKFIRPASALALSEPKRGGGFSKIFGVLNVSERDRVLCAGWLLSSLQPDGPYFHANFIGEQGTGKSGACRFLRNLIDPSTVPLRRGTTEERSLWVAAALNRVLAFENLSAIPSWLSDALCSMSTGGGYSSRQLYSDSDETIFSAKRPVLLNGIVDVVHRPDLAERTIRIELEPIPKNLRRTEADLNKHFIAIAPEALGALFDSVSFGLSRLDSFQVGGLPRMADASRWIEACLPKLGFAAGSFLEALERHEHESAESILDGVPIAQALKRLVADEAYWYGPAGDLLSALGQLSPDDSRQREWPKHPRSLAGVLRRVAPALRRLGIQIQPPAPTDKLRRYRITRHEDRVAETPPEPPEPPKGPSTGGFPSGGPLDNPTPTAQRPPELKPAPVAHLGDVGGLGGPTATLTEEPTFV